MKVFPGRIGASKPVAEHNSETSHNTRANNESFGAQIVQTNQISTPVVLGVLAVLILAIAIACVAVGYAMQAEREAQNAEREARVALNHSEELKVVADENKVLIEVLGLKGASKKEP